eukprot:SAG25_NODE_682_length_5948_cov_2.801334_3_plen_312_part_00
MPKMCEDCKRKKAHYGLEADGKRRWCGACGKQHRAIRIGGRKMCEDCKRTQANYGLEADGKRRWCGACSKQHGAIHIGAQKMCEDCSSTRANYGLEAEGKRRWCGACSKQHRAIRIGAQKMCEDCSRTQASYGLEAEGKRRWCGACGKQHEAIHIGGRKMCEECGKIQCSFEPVGGGVDGSGVARFCAACADAKCAALQKVQEGLAVNHRSGSFQGYRCKGTDGKGCPQGQICWLQYRTVTSGIQLCTWCLQGSHEAAYAITPAEFARQGLGSRRSKRSRTSATVESTEGELQQPIKRRNTRRCRSNKQST